MNEILFRLGPVRMLAGLIVIAGATGPLRAISPAEEPVVKAVERVMPTVCNINTERTVGSRYVYDAYFRKFYSVPQKGFSLGSGLLVGSEGYIVTNAHVVEMADGLKIRVTLSNGSAYDAKFITSDPDKDLALIKVEDKTPFAALDLKTLSPNLLGQTVIALGNPVGYQNSVSTGILSAKNRTITAESGTMHDMLQTDAAINPGNSGGPLVDINGNFVGLNSAKMNGQAVEGLGFAIPAETVAQWLTDAIAIAKGEKEAPTPIAPGDVLRKRFGLEFQTLTPELADAFGYRTSGGLVITKVDDDGPAGKAGLQRGMVIVGMGSFNTTNEQSLPREILRLNTGSKVRFTVVVLENINGRMRQRGGEVMLTAR